MTFAVRTAAVVGTCAALIGVATVCRAEKGGDPLPASIAGSFRPPEEFAGKPGDYRSPLVFDDGRPVRTREDWQKRRAEIRKAWHEIMGPWPPLVETPKIEFLETTRREGFTQHRARIQIAPDRTTVGYLLVPDGEGPFPAVLVPYYQAETGAGLDDSELRDFGYQLTKRGFVSLSIGTPGSRHYPSEEKAQLQPLSYLAYVAANCANALAAMEQVDGERIAVNRLLGHEDRVAMINRPRHGPRPEDNQKVYAFFEHFLKAGRTD